MKTCASGRFFAQGETISIREFVVGAFNAEMGLESPDADLVAASSGQDVVTPSGMVLSGSQDRIEAPPASNPFDDPDGDGVTDEIPVSIVDHMEFYLLNYFRPGTYRQNKLTEKGARIFNNIGCAQCHIPDLQIDQDRRVADVLTQYDRQNGVVAFNNLFATAATKFVEIDDGVGHPTLKEPAMEPFKVEGDLHRLQTSRPWPTVLGASFRRHDSERIYDRAPLGGGFDGAVRP